MSKLYITEFSRLGISSNGGTAQIMDFDSVVTVQPPIDYSAGAAQSAAISDGTRYVRVETDAICSIKYGSNPTATTNDQRMAAGDVEHFYVSRGNKISVITNT